jgi:Xaa-Pro aminopeptidase
MTMTLSTASPSQPGADAFRHKILPVRSQADVKNDWLRHRLEEVLPAIMKREGLDLWIVVAREYNEDPVIMSLLPAPAMSARRRTILVFSLDATGGVERLTLDRYGHGDFYVAAWDPDQEGQYECLSRIVRERDPQAIGLDVSETHAFGDGLTHSEYKRLSAALDEKYRGRTRSAEGLVLGWLEHRTKPELAAYPGIVGIGHALIAEAFSSRTIHPGITTTDDVVWWMRQKMLDLGLEAWFQPTIEIQALGQAFPLPGASHGDKAARRNRILPGDLLHCDVGFYYLGLATDQQQHAYVLKPGEEDAPQGLKAALAEGNRLQEILAGTMVVGRTGNEILKAALHQARQEGLRPSIYTHPLGYHGHGAGPTIGLWDRQEGVPGQGDYPLFDHTCYAIELSVAKAVPEWEGQEVRIALEEDAMVADGQFYWLSGRQIEFHLIR